MARYRIGDIVNFYNPAQMFGNRQGVIAEVLEDAEINPQLQHSKYRISSRLRDDRERFNTANDAQMTLVSRPEAPMPAPTVNGQEVVQNQTENQLQFQPFRMNAEWLADIDIWGNPDTEMRIQARENIAQYTVDGIAPIDFLVIDGVVKPVFDSRTWRGGLNVDDYSMPNVRERYFAYYLDDLALMPIYRRNEGVVFFCVQTGDYWINQYQHRDVANMGNRRRDNMHVCWIQKRLITEGNNNQALPQVGTVRKSKKKLRHKYKEMPTIRDAKNYASKEFIA